MKETGKVRDTYSEQCKLVEKDGIYTKIPDVQRIEENKSMFGDVEVQKAKGGTPPTSTMKPKEVDGGLTETPLQKDY